MRAPAADCRPGAPWVPTLTRIATERDGAMRATRSIIAVLVLAAGVVAAQPASAAPAGAAHRARTTNGFSAHGPWNTRLPRTVPLAPNSAAVVENIRLDKVNIYGSWAVNTD